MAYDPSIPVDNSPMVASEIRSQLAGLLTLQDRFESISKGGTYYNKYGISVSSSDPLYIISWRAPMACTVTNVRGYRKGGTGAQINARRNGADDHLSSHLSVSTCDTWLDGGSVQNTSISIGDKLEIAIISTSGSPTQVAVQIDLTISS